MAIPRYRPQRGPAILAAGFRPFFLLAALWAAVAIPLWLLFFAGDAAPPTLLSPVVWHVHAMVYGFGAATVAGFLLTAIPNWTGRMPLQGAPLGGLVLLWLLGRVGVLLSAKIGAVAAAALDLSFPAVFLAVIAREIVAGKNWRNLPMVAVLSLFLIGNLLVHLESLGLARTALLGDRIGVATLVMLVSFIGGRIVPSFTRNWLAKANPAAAPPAGFGAIDRVALLLTALALAAWALAPGVAAAPYLELAAGLALGFRLVRWRGFAAWRDPLVFVLHLGYGWVVLGLLLLGLDGFWPALPQTAAVHALTVGAVGTMTLAVMTRASLGHSGRGLRAGAGTTAIYGLVTLAALLRLAAPLAGGDYLFALMLAGAAWSAAFGLFFALYFPLLARPRTRQLVAGPA